MNVELIGSGWKGTYLDPSDNSANFMMDNGFGVNKRMKIIR